MGKKIHLPGFAKTGKTIGTTFHVAGNFNEFMILNWQTFNFK